MLRWKPPARPSRDLNAHGPFVLDSEEVIYDFRYYGHAVCDNLL